MWRPAVESPTRLSLSGVVFSRYEGLSARYPFALLRIRVSAPVRIIQ